MSRYVNNLPSGYKIVRRERDGRYVIVDIVRHRLYNNARGYGYTNIYRAVRALIFLTKNDWGPCIGKQISN